MRVQLIVLGIVFLTCLAHGSYCGTQAQTSVAQSYYEQGKRNLEANHCAEAVDAFRKAIAIEPASVVYNALGRAYDCLDKEAEAETSFQQAIRLDPNNTSALFNLGFEYAHHVKIEEAKNVLLELKRKDPDRARKLETEIQGAYDADRALESGKKLFADHDSKKYLAEGTKYRESKDYIRAIESDKKSISVKPSSDAYNELGLSYFALKQNSNAALAFQQAIQLKPGDSALLYNLANAYFEMGQYEKSKTSLRDALRLKPNYADAIYLLGDAHFQLNEFTQAIAQFQQVIRLKPSSDAYNKLGLNYLELKQNTNAVAAFQQAIKLEPGDFTLHYNLSVAYLEIGEYEKTKTSAKEALRLKPDFADAIDSLGVAHLRLKEYAEAITEFQKAIRLAPDNARFYHNIGKTYFLMGRKADAQLVYKKLLTLDNEWAQKLYEIMNPPPRKTHN